MSFPGKNLAALRTVRYCLMRRNPLILCTFTCPFLEAGLLSQKCSPCLKFLEKVYGKQDFRR